MPRGLAELYLCSAALFLPGKRLTGHFTFAALRNKPQSVKSKKLRVYAAKTVNFIKSLF